MSAASLLLGALTRFLGGSGGSGRPRSRRAAPGGGDDAQLALDFTAEPPRPAPAPAIDTRAPEPPPPPMAAPRRRSSAAADRALADALLQRLRALGLRGADAGGIDRLRLTRNRTVMVSFRRGELRVHRGYADAPEPVLAAIVAFVQARTRRQRTAAQRVILAHSTAHAVAGEAGGLSPAPRPRARERTLPEDEPMVRVLVEWHRRYNDRHFGGTLSSIPIRVSRRLRTRLGHYTGRTADGVPAEIVVGRAHIRRHGWDEALHTLLHEMVHQWQDESGHAIDHGRTFRRKAREVGITAAARRAVGGRASQGAPPDALAPQRRRLAG